VEYINYFVNKLIYPDEIPQLEFFCNDGHYFGGSMAEKSCPELEAQITDTVGWALPVFC
jgi:hypothetical protein